MVEIFIAALRRLGDVVEVPTGETAFVAQDSSLDLGDDMWPKAEMDGTWYGKIVEYPAR